MDNKVKAVPFLTVIAIVLIAISMMSATQYVTVTHAVSAKVTIQEAWICPLAREPAVATGHNWLINSTETSGAIKTYTISVGNWLPGTKICFTSAFGIVNNQTKPVNMTLNVTGTGAGYTIVAAHVNATKTTNGTLATAFGTSTDTDMRELHNGTTSPWSNSYWNIGNISDTWTGGTYIARNYSSAQPGTSIQTAYVATWDGTTDYVYYYDTNDYGYKPTDTYYGVKEHSGNTAGTWGSNYVWIEIIVGIPPTEDATTMTLTLEFRFHTWKTVASEF